MRLLPLLLLGAVAAAQPTSIPHYQRIDELHYAYKTRIAELERQEEFARKPAQERMILLFRRQEPFEGKELEGSDVVKAIFSWDAFDRETPTEEAVRVGSLLPDALKTRYSGAANYETRRKQQAAAELADHLTAKHVHQRKLAIDCLMAMYGNDGLMYKPDAQPSDRAKKKRDWIDYIRKSR